MKKFQFRFETVQNFRVTKEKESLGEMVRAREEFRALLEKKRSFLIQIEEALERREAASQRPVSTILDYQIENEFILGTKNRMSQLEPKILKHKKKFEKTMAIYLSRLKDRKVMDRLRDLDLRNFVKEVDRRERKVLDELSITMSGRRQALFDEDGAA